MSYSSVHFKEVAEVSCHSISVFFSFAIELIDEVSWNEESGYGWFIFVQVLDWKNL